MRASTFDDGTWLSEVAPIRIEGNRAVRTFDSLAKFAEVADHAPAHYEGSNSSSGAGGTRADAVRMASGEGWQGAKDDVERISAHVSRLIDAETIADSFAYTYDVTGGAVDVGRYLSGAPECMVEVIPQKVARRGKVARILVPTAYAWSVPTEIVMRRGAAVLALIDAMSKAHYSLEVWAISAQASKRGEKRHLAYAVKVQDAAEAYRSEMIAYGVGHPTMLRRLTFLIEDQENAATQRDWTASKGTAPYTASIKDLPPDCQDGPAIVLPVLEPRSYPWTRDEDIARWIESQVQSIVDPVSEQE